MTLFDPDPPRPKKKRRRKPEPDPIERNFAEDIKRGRATELAVAGDLEARGFDVAVPESGWVPEDKDNQADLIVESKAILEVKARGFRFRGPWDYPYPTAFLGSVDRWQRRTVLPAAVVLVSEKTGAKLAVWTDTMDDWETEARHDKYRNKDEVSYAAPRRLLWRWKPFVEELRRRVA
jgi:hypothetical protein